MDGKLGTSLITAATVVDGTGRPGPSATGILVEDGVIRQVGPREALIAPPSADVVDLGSWTLMPGLIDAHTHFSGVTSDKLYLRYFESDAYRALWAADEARRMLEAGITAARCCGSPITPSLRRAINDGLVAGPRLVAAGAFVCTTSGGWDPDQAFSLPLDYAKANKVIADGVDGLVEMVRQRIRSGSNFIKIANSKGKWNDGFHVWGDDPYDQALGMRPEEVRAVIEEAHNNRMRVAVHSVGDEAIRTALQYGADTIEHGYGISDDTRRLLVDSQTTVVTTFLVLELMRLNVAPWGFSEAIVDKHIDAQRADFEKGLAAGVRYALGSDLYGRPTHPLDAFARELELAVAYGMTPEQAVVGGTLRSAEALGMADSIGSIEPGKLADVIGVDGDPRDDITAVHRVGFVMQGGRVVVDRRDDGGAGAALRRAPLV